MINGKAGKAAALPKFSDTLTLSQSEGADYAQPLALPHPKKFRDYAPEYVQQWIRVRQRTLDIGYPFVSNFSVL